MGQEVAFHLSGVPWLEMVVFIVMSYVGNDGGLPQKHVLPSFRYDYASIDPQNATSVCLFIYQLSFTTDELCEVGQDV